ncbi:glycosyltransferase family 2 protein [Fibrella aquatica]|uniref:glycosyltransferase family 2 protein n=1 Tax=Fibrella aquatica TaxID=3242487 RepID=UPI0035220A3E
MLPSITVITPSYNQGQFIGQTIESVLSQGYPNLQYLIIDGASTDHTADVVAPYRGQLTFITERDRGQTDAINKGLRMATGDIVCWLNSDDYFLPGTLQAVGTFFAANPDTVWLTGDCQIVDEAGQTIQEPIRQYKRLLRSLSPAAFLGVTNAVCQPATFWRRSVHQQLGYLREDLRYTMDYDWWLRLAQLQAPAVSKQLFSVFRIHSASKGGSQYVPQFQEDFETLRRHMSSPLVRGLHSLHNQLITGVYRVLK